MRRTKTWAGLLIAGCTVAACSGGGYSSGGGTGGGGGGQSGVRDAVYVAASASGGEILTFIFDTSAGTLSSYGTAVTGPPSGLDIKIDPAANYLYASDFDSNSIYGYSIDPSAGKLTAITGSPFPFPGTVPPNRGNGGPLTIDPAGKFVFYSDAFGNITSFVINASTGALSPTSAPVVNDCLQPIHMLVAPSGKFLYVVNHQDSSGPEFCIYSINSGTGALTLLNGTGFTFQTNSEPWGMVMNPTGTFLYTSLSNAGQVAGLSVDTTTGNLTQLSASPYLAGFIPQGIALGGGGQYLYAGNEGDATISIYKVDPTTGVLSVNGSFMEGNPSFLATDTTGQNLLVLGQVNGPLTAYKIAANTGGLSRLSSVTAGTSNLPAMAVLQLK